MTFYQKLIQETEQGQQYLLSAPIITDVFEGRFSIETYIAFLNQAYHHVKHTAPLLMAAGAKLSHEQTWVRSALSEYISEENGHEQWILDDIEACGYSRHYFEVCPAPYTSELMVAYLYDTIARKNPMGVFGMVLVLEGTSSSLAPAVAAIVREKLALPDTAMTYLTTHGELDQDHIKFFESLMNRIENTEDQQAIVHAANCVYQLYGDVYRSLAGAAAEITNLKVA